MPFWKKMFNKKQAVYYPRAVLQGNPVETETIAKDLAMISTVSNSDADVQAVLGGISGVMHTRMTQGKSVHINGLDCFRYMLGNTGVKSLNDTYTRALVDSDQLEWIELSPDTKDNDPAQDDDEDVTENPLG